MKTYSLNFNFFSFSCLSLSLMGWGAPKLEEFEQQKPLGIIRYLSKIDLKKQGVKRKSNRLKIRYSHRLLRNFKSLCSIAKKIAYLESQSLRLGCWLHSQGSI
jgi:hypothetical protein